MMDLFGDTITTPVYSGSSLINPEHGFAEWWKAYPRHERKVGKPWCLQAWKSRKLANDASHIIQYTLWRASQDDWCVNGFIPMPKTFINAAGWIDWEPVAVVVKPKICPALKKTYDDDKKAVKPPPEIRAKLAQFKVGVKA